MLAERLILETDPTGLVRNLPLLPPNRKVEAIFLIIDECETVAHRKPHPDLAGKMKIVGDIMNSAPATAWNLPT
jgi:hypothetical protein